MFRPSLFILALSLFLICLSFPGKSVLAYDSGKSLHTSNETSSPSASRNRDVLLAKQGDRKRKGSGRKKSKKDDGGGSGSKSEPCTECQALDGFVPPEEISDTIRMMAGKGKKFDKSKSVEIQKARGGIETGLEADFIGGAECPQIDSEQWAIDYTHKRGKPAIHKGVDIPQPIGTPILALAAGTVVGSFMNVGNMKGIEVMLRHTPEQTGLPYWTYTQYTHLRELSPLPIGAQVELGQSVGITHNTGKMGKRIRRDALHLAILYSESPEWSNDGRFVIPKDSYWMDPNAFYRSKGPYDSQSLEVLPSDQKSVPVPYMKPDGSFVPPDTKRIWPYPCE